jgi:hypothetical protein
VSEFVKRKLAEQNRKPGGKKKKGAAAAAAATVAAPVSSGVSAAGVGLINTGEIAGVWLYGGLETCYVSSLYLGWFIIVPGLRLLRVQQ